MTELKKAVEKKAQTLEQALEGITSVRAMKEFIKKEFGGRILHAKVAVRRPLAPMGRKVAGAIAQINGTDGFEGGMCVAQVADVAELLGVSDKKVIGALAALQEQGYVLPIQEVVENHPVTYLGLTKVGYEAIGYIEGEGDFTEEV